MDGEQILLGVLDYIEAEVLPEAPRPSRFLLRWVIRFARDWKKVRGYIERAGEKTKKERVQKGETSKGT